MPATPAKVLPIIWTAEDKAKHDEKNAINANNLQRELIDMLRIKGKTEEEIAEYLAA